MNTRKAIGVKGAWACAMLVVTAALAGMLGGCSRAGELAYARRGDEIMVCGQLFHTGAPVVLWTDPGGYDAYRTEKRFGPLEAASWDATRAGGRGPETPSRYNTRFFRFAAEQPEFVGAAGAAGISDEVIARVRGGGWSLEELRQVVDQFVLHYDVCGTSRQCFRVLHDLRGLSVHFMLDIDGTIYQTLDLKERAWHATSSNDRSIGIEIASIGAYPPAAEGTVGAIDSAGEFAGRIGLPTTLERWYLRDKLGWYVHLPEEMGDGGVRTRGFVGRPVRRGPVVGEVQGRRLVQFDLTAEQYDSLIKLTAALCRVFPNLPRDYPRDAGGALITRRLEEEELRRFRGVLGHFHIQTNKVDPGPALQWEAVMGRKRLER
ncbi:MAG: N-acetylmuramoyl-L-alanine amidase [Phycisphaerales bacterium]